jgi:hypothetical protein
MSSEKSSYTKKISQRRETSFAHAPRLRAQATAGAESLQGVTAGLTQAPKGKECHRGWRTNTSVLSGQ